MIKSLFAALDTKSGVYSNPFASVNSETAIRDFDYEVNRGNSEINRYPEDFSLWFLGNYDDQTGLITPGQEILVHAKALVRSE